MSELKKIFNKVGGLQLLKQYSRAGVLIYAMLLVLTLGLSRKSLEILRLAINNKIIQKLRKKYRLYIAEYKSNLSDENTKLENKKSNKIWICWLQGIENAPLLVQKCNDSIKKYLSNREIIVLTESNYREYVTFPKSIQEKLDSGIITKTHFSDLLRLELLINYGGTWLDATVLCTGGSIPEYILDSDLFLFQLLKPGLDGHSTSISSWLMTSCTNHPILLLTRALLYKYWSENNYLIDYFLIHKFFQLAIEAYPEKWREVVQFSNEVPHILLLSLFDQFDESKFKHIKNMTNFHKLSYKHNDELLKINGSYYDLIINHNRY